jgi:hypothetical protein
MQIVDWPGRRRCLIRCGAIVVLLVALLPSIAYLGHWPLGPSDDHHFHTPAEAEAHATHCHTTASQCTGEAATTGTFWFGDDASPIPADGQLRQIELGQREPAQEPSVPIDTPPPRFA